MSVLAVNVGSALVDGLREAVGIQAAYYALAAVGLNLQFGYAGLLNFGHIASALVGAYGAAIVVDNGGSLWLGILVGVIAAGLLGLLMGMPTLRLRADYLAIATISVAEILRVVTNSTRGVCGQRVISSLRMRAVVDLPTATDPATPTMNGTRVGRSPRNSLVASRSPCVASTSKCSSRDIGRYTSSTSCRLTRSPTPRKRARSSTVRLMGWFSRSRAQPSRPNTT